MADTNLLEPNLIETAERLYSLEQVRDAIAVQAGELNHAYRGPRSEPVVALTLLNGGLVYAGMLIPMLDFELVIDSVRVSRYRDKTHGGELNWHVEPGTSLVNRQVLLLDDIYDQGVTLQLVREWCEQRGASRVQNAVLAWKQPQPGVGMNGTAPDSHALTVPDKFVVGMGMDFAERYRNAPGIFAINGNH